MYLPAWLADLVCVPFRVEGDLLVTSAEEERERGDVHTGFLLVVI